MRLDINIHSEHDGFCQHVEEYIHSEMLGIFGPSGSGKTTLLHILAGLRTPIKGRIVLDGHTLFDSSKNIHLPVHKRGIGMVFQDHRLFPHLSVTDNLAYGMKSDNSGPTFERIVDILKLDLLLARPVTTLSGGEAQRVAIGRALLAAPRLLLLDEPCASLDPTLRAEILGYLISVQREFDLPMILVSHQLTDLLRLTEMLLVLERGSVRGHGPYTSIALVQQCRTS